MAFFDDSSRKPKGVAADLENQKAILENAFSALGKAYFEAHGDDPEDALKGQIDVVRVAQKRVDIYTELVSRMRGVRTCPNPACRAEVSAASAFCNICGTKLSAPEPLFDGENVYCEKCGSPMQPGKKFCTSCGAPLPMVGVPAGPVCANCGSRLDPGQRFCTVCGTPAPATEAPAAAAAPVSEAPAAPAPVFEAPAAPAFEPTPAEEAPFEPAAEEPEGSAAEEPKEPAEEAPAAPAAEEPAAEEPAAPVFEAPAAPAFEAPAAPVFEAPAAPVFEAPAAPVFEAPVFTPPAQPAPEQSVVCPSCGKVLSAGVRFCTSCGQNLAAPPAPAVRTCPACGKEVSPTAVFCTGCGTKL